MSFLVQVQEEQSVAFSLMVSGDSADCTRSAPATGHPRRTESIWTGTPVLPSEPNAPRTHSDSGSWQAVESFSRHRLPALTEMMRRTSCHDAAAHNGRDEDSPTFPASRYVRFAPSILHL